MTAGAGATGLVMISVTDPLVLTVVALVFLLAGTVKGVIGLGLPTVALGLLTAFVGLQPAIALMLVPSLVTNVWQASVGGHFAAVLKRMWPLLAAAAVMILVGAQFAVFVGYARLAPLLGAVLFLYGLFGLARPVMRLPSRVEIWAGPATGAVNGLLTGLTGSLGIPGIMYLQALGLPRDAFIQAMGLLFTVSTLALALAFGAHDLLTADLGFVSAAAILPALAGMVMGQRIRARLSETAFRRVFYTAMILLGAYIALRW